VICWAALLKNEGKKCGNISTENFWREHAIREGRVNNDTSSIFCKIKKHRALFETPVLFFFQRMYSGFHKYIPIDRFS